MTVQKHEISEEAIVKYGGLSNAELMLVYYRMKNYLDKLEKNLAENKASKSIETPMGTATAIITVSPEHVQRFRESEYYKLANSVVEKLGPLVELVIECDESLRVLSNELR